MNYDVEEVLKRALVRAESELDTQQKNAVYSSIKQPLEKAEEAHVRARLDLWIFENVTSLTGYRFK